jgi:hypothetical protein
LSPSPSISKDLAYCVNKLWPICDALKNLATVLQAAKIFVAALWSIKLIKKISLTLIIILHYNYNIITYYLKLTL